MNCHDIVFAIVYSNYEPPEVHSLWVTRELAMEKLADMSDSDLWHVVPWEVGTE